MLSRKTPKGPLRGPGLAVGRVATRPRGARSARREPACSRCRPSARPRTGSRRAGGACARSRPCARAAGGLVLPMLLAAISPLTVGAGAAGTRSERVKKMVNVVTGPCCSAGDTPRVGWCRRLHLLQTSIASKKTVRPVTLSLSEPEGYDRAMAKTNTTKNKHGQAEGHPHPLPGSRRRGAEQARGRARRLEVRRHGERDEDAARRDAEEAARPRRAREARREAREAAGGDGRRSRPRSKPAARKPAAPKNPPA